MGGAWLKMVEWMPRPFSLGYYLWPKGCDNEDNHNLRTDDSEPGDRHS
jgi:hypothetical protein